MYHFSPFVVCMFVSLKGVYMKNRKLYLVTGLALMVFTMLYTPALAQPAGAQNDLFQVLEGSCNNYMDVTANDPVSGQAFVLDIITQPAGGTAGININDGGYLFYCANNGFRGADQFTYMLTVGGVTSTATVYINVRSANNFIYPGDADQNGRIENYDVLALGLAYNLTGPARSNAASVSALAWQPTSFTNNDPGAADCNGDGIVDSTDLQPIELAYHDTVPYPPYFAMDTSTCLNGLPFYIETLTGDSVNDLDTLDVAINLGSALSLGSAYGIAFTLEFDKGFIGGNDIEFNTGPSWLLQNTRSLFFKRSFQSEGMVDLALTRTDHTNSNGGGVLLRARLPIDDNIDGIASAPGWHNLHFKITGVRLVNAYNVVQGVCLQQPALFVYKSATGTGGQPGADMLKVYPNPANDILVLEASNIRNIEITDLTGRVIERFNMVPANKVQLNLKQLNLARGTYLIKIRTNDFTSVRKIFIQH
jgi:hypothetical protein